MRGREILALLLVILVGITYPVVFVIVFVVLVIIAIRAAAKKEEQKYLEIELELKKQQQEEERKKQEKRIMGEYIVRYLANRELNNNAHIFTCHRDMSSSFDKTSLQRITKRLETVLANVEQKSRAATSSREMDEALGTKEMCVALLRFLEDLEKFYKLFHKKGLHTDYLELMELFAEAVEHDINKEFENLLLPVFERISERVGENVTIENVIREFMPALPDAECDFNILSKLLDKFGLQYDQEEVEKMIRRIREDIELEEFEQNLGSLPKTAIGDFEKLTGYEFETYLKELFGLLDYTVIQTSLSGDQGADLIVSKDGKKIVVQAKKYHGKVSNNAIQEIVAAKNHYQADGALVVTDSSFTKSAIALALSNNVELWDGSKLKDVIQSLKDKRQETRTVTISPTFQEGKDIQNIKIPCPFCKEEFEREVDVREESFDTKCPHCGAELSGNIDFGSWECAYCLKEFNAKTEAEKHEKTCKARSGKVIITKETLEQLKRFSTVSFAVWPFNPDKDLGKLHNRVIILGLNPSAGITFGENFHMPNHKYDKLYREGFSRPPFVGAFMTDLISHSEPESKIVHEKWRKNHEFREKNIKDLREQFTILGVRASTPILCIGQGTRNLFSPMFPEFEHVFSVHHPNAKVKGPQKEIFLEKLEEIGQKISSVLK